VSQSAPPDLAALASAYGVATKAKLSNRAIVGAPEDQLRGPLEAFVLGLARLGGLPDGAVRLVGETTLSSLNIRPDFAVTVRDALVGFVEVKAPGKGADPRRFTDDHDKRQWRKLQSLPNLIYTDGNAFALVRDGVMQGSVVHLDGDVETSGAKLAAPPALATLVADFLAWSPVPPRSVKQLAETTARLCRLLREEVTEELERGNPGLTSLATEWRALLFPQADAEQFADGYAQAVTFGLLVARARGISLGAGIDAAALELRRTNSLVATALRLLTDDPENKKALQSALDTLSRVLDAVDWPSLTKGDPEAWIYFYEDFLAVYDNALRKRTGSYYTPPEVVDAMVRLVDEALRDPALFGLPMGLAAREVTLCDPAVGTGAYLLGALRRIASAVAADRGQGAVPGAIESAVQRLIGFEMQFGPYAVAELRLMAEVQTLMSIAAGDGRNLPQLRLHVTDTLGDPYATQTQFSGLVAPIGESRRKANQVKREEKITVVIGNPPYKEKARGRGGWIEAGSAGRPSAMSLWAAPGDWGIGAHLKHLKNLYVYFWRWATWKVFGSGHAATTGEAAAADRAGIVCFITVAGFLNGPGFQKMRADLREDCSDIWVIDCSPEGHQPEVPTRVFQGVQQPVCIVLALRKPGKDRTVPARLRYRALPEGRREAKFAALAQASLSDGDWEMGPTGWREPFLSERTGSWSDFVSLGSVFEFTIPGVLAGRTWVISPDKQSLERRWTTLVGERDATEKERLFHPTLRGGQLADRHTRKVVREGLSGHEFRAGVVAEDRGRAVLPVRYASRTLDRQWIIPDNRLLLSARPSLWAIQSPHQVHITAVDASSPSSGPALSFTDLIPDNDHYHGRGGRVFPLWRDAAATIPNVKAELLAHLSDAYAAPVSPEDVFAWIAALLAHPAFTARFQKDLVRPGLRVPLTADAALFAKGVALGREVIWLHTHGERFVDAAAGRPKGAPRLADGLKPVFAEGRGIPGAPAPLPDDMSYDPATRRLTIGGGVVENVTPAMWAYDVSGKNVLRQWFSYRKRDRSRPIIGDRRPPSPLDSIQPDHWLDEYTEDLLNLLNVLGAPLLPPPPVDN
jgi:hypothetical protein